MRDYFYRFDDRAAMLASLEPLGMTYTPMPEPQIDPETGRKLISAAPIYQAGPEVVQGSHQFALWEVGQLSGYDGWHINLRVIDEALDVSSLAAFEVRPGQPKVVWA
jgi:hypothetical protein